MSALRGRVLCAETTDADKHDSRRGAASSCRYCDVINHVFDGLHIPFFAYVCITTMRNKEVLNTIKGIYARGRDDCTRTRCRFWDQIDERRARGGQ